MHPADVQGITVKSCGHHVLQQLGYTGFTSCISAWPILSASLWKRVSFQLIMLRGGGLGSQWQERLDSGELQLPSAQLCL
eukprot:1760025-Alexandrium_andersonii.AAC.1